jgi:hypothetical protein
MPMSMQIRLAGLLLLAPALFACAGTPPGGQQAAAPKHCERVTGSMLCGNYDDNPMGTAKDTSVQEHFGAVPGSK